MKILTASQVREADAYTIRQEPIASIDLMERASLAFVRCFSEFFVNTRPVAIFCGKGNNGGDGLAIARLLSERSYQVSVFVLEYTALASADFQINNTRLGDHLTPTSVRNSSEIPAFNDEVVLIDALLGTGLSRPATGLVADVIKAINALPNKKVSVDIASGLFADGPNEKSNTILQPDLTISFQLPKLAFMIPGNEKFCGDWHVVDIGLSKFLLDTLPTKYYFTDSGSAQKFLRKRNKFSHKGTFGHALLIAGSYGKMGAAVLAAKSCLRSGTGLLSVHIPSCGYMIMQTAVPEAMVTTDGEYGHLTKLPDLTGYSSIGIGPGIGQEPGTALALRLLLQKATMPLVIDADALNLISADPKLLEMLPANTILTPHPKEFDRLTGKTEDPFHRLELARNFAQKHQIILCLKGAHTAVVLPDGNVHFNSTGNAGMATGGSGDVLTGIITGLLAQGYSPSEAAIFGVFQHGLAGDRAATKKGQSAMIASDIVENLGW